MRKQNLSLLVRVLSPSLSQSSTWATGRAIVREHGLGLRGLNRGLSATLGRHGVFNMIYFRLF